MVVAVVGVTVVVVFGAKGRGVGRLSDGLVPNAWACICRFISDRFHASMNWSRIVMR